MTSAADATTRSHPMTAVDRSHQLAGCPDRDNCPTGEHPPRALLDALDRVKATRNVTPAELRHLRALHAEVARFIDVIDTRRRAGWTKVPVRDVERLRAALAGGAR